jgi:hypothetical protein
LLVASLLELTTNELSGEKHVAVTLPSWSSSVRTSSRVFMS